MLAACNVLKTHLSDTKAVSSKDVVSLSHYVVLSPVICNVLFYVKMRR